MRSRWPVWLLGAVLSAPDLAAQPNPRVKDLAPGKFLVAKRNLPDPNFAETVVLLLHYDEGGAMGLIINRDLEVPMSRALRELDTAKARKDSVYLGGPVERSIVLGLLRARTRPEGARRVFGDVYMIGDKTLLEKTLAAVTDPAALHVFLGYSGWGPGQLEYELGLGTWHIFDADAKFVFDPDPDSVWTRLIRRTEAQIARVSP